MSIQQEIVRLETAGLLMRYLPRSSRTPRRRLYLTQGAQKDLTDPYSAVNSLVGKGFIIAALDRWVLGDLIYGHKRGEFLDRLDPPPPEIWEIRVTPPRTQARLFGRFVEPDTLILTRFHTRSMLGNRGSSGWTAAMQACDQMWSGSLASLPPFVASQVKSYVTENCDDYPI